MLPIEKQATDSVQSHPQSCLGPTPPELRVAQAEYGAVGLRSFVLPLELMWHEKNGRRVIKKVAEFPSES